MELPPYRLPSLRSIGLRLLDRSRIFLRRAGTIIFAVAIVLWTLTQFPRVEGGPPPIDDSALGRMGQLIEPAIEPLGFDWRIGVGLITSLGAREVMVSTMATMHNLGSAGDDVRSLRDILRQSTDPESGRHLYTPLIALSLMVFFVLACQCMSTVAVVRRETNSWRWPLFMIAMMNVLAWLASFAIFQGGRLLGFQ
jgi:ferrous iron transport protein B